jgi:hypothetical protein
METAFTYANWKHGQRQLSHNTEFPCLVIYVHQLEILSASALSVDKVPKVCQVRLLETQPETKKSIKNAAWKYNQIQMEQVLKWRKITDYSNWKPCQNQPPRRMVILPEPAPPWAWAFQIMQVGSNVNFSSPGRSSTSDSLGRPVGNTARTSSPRRSSLHNLSRTQVGNTSRTSSSGRQ